MQLVYLRLKNIIFFPPHEVFFEVNKTNSCLLLIKLYFIKCMQILKFLLENFNILKKSLDEYPGGLYKFGGHFDAMKKYTS